MARYTGTIRRFNYPRHFTTLPNYTTHRGCLVKVGRRVPNTEEPMYHIVALRDGWKGEAWISELGKAQKAKE